MEREGMLMKMFRKRAGAVFISLAVLLAVLSGGAEDVQAAQEPIPAPEAYLDLIAVDNSSGASLTDTSLELGDVVTYQIVATQVLNDLSEPIGMISGYLDYDGDVFEQVVNSDFTPAAGWTVYWDAPTQKFSIQAPADLRFVTGDVICRIQLKIKRAVTANVAVGIVGDLSDDAKPLEIRQHNNARETICYAENVSRTLNNTVSETSRVFEMEVPKNLTFYTDPPANDKVVRVPISIKSGSIYAGFRISFSYNATLLTYEGYELSQTAGAYVQMITQSDPILSNPSLVTRNIALVSSRDINQAGDFLYLKFKTNSGVSSGVVGASLTVNLYEAVNQSRAPMTYKLTGTSSYEGTTTEELVLTENIPLIFTTRSVVRGDVNNDRKINLIDALLVMQYYNGVRNLSTVEGPGEIGTEYERADVNLSNTVTLVDALLILKYYNGEIQSFPTV